MVDSEGLFWHFGLYEGYYHETQLSPLAKADRASGAQIERAANSALASGAAAQMVGNGSGANLSPGRDHREEQGLLPRVAAGR